VLFHQKPTQINKYAVLKTGKFIEGKESGAYGDCSFTVPYSVVFPINNIVCGRLRVT